MEMEQIQEKVTQRVMARETEPILKMTDQHLTVINDKIALLDGFIKLMRDTQADGKNFDVDCLESIAYALEHISDEIAHEAINFSNGMYDIVMGE